jgi:ribosomal protein L25 (general stress protein Ctc)
MKLKQANGNRGQRAFKGAAARGAKSRNFVRPQNRTEKLSIDTLDLEPIFKSGAVAQKLLKLEIEGGRQKQSHDQRDAKHPVSRILLHMDFYEVAMDRKVNVNGSRRDHRQERWR